MVLNGRELYVDEANGSVKAKDCKAITRADAIKVFAEVKAKLLEEYWEYKALQVELREYFLAFNKINE
jgi:hypothetical protein